MDGNSDEKIQLKLHIPEYEELWYRRKIMSDKATMGYNKGYDLQIEGYDKVTGCIEFPETEWKEWYSYFVGNEPECFYAYVRNMSDNEFIGEVNIHRRSGADDYDMGIVIEGKYRGKGYAVEALRLLLYHAFENIGAAAVYNDFETDRKAADSVHIKAGFKKYDSRQGISSYVITKEDWEQGKQEIKTEY